MHVGACPLRKTFEEVSDEFRLKIAHSVDLQLQIDDGMNSAAEIDCRDGERFIHGHDEVTGPVDSSTIAERARNGLAQGNADVFHGVMLIDVQVALGGEFQVERAMPGKQLEHVVKEPDSRVHVVATLAIE